MQLMSQINKYQQLGNQNLSKVLQRDLGKTEDLELLKQIYQTSQGQYEQANDQFIKLERLISQTLQLKSNKIRWKNLRRLSRFLKILLSYIELQFSLQIRRSYDHLYQDYQIDQVLMNLKFLYLNQFNKSTQEFIKLYQNHQTKEVPQALRTNKGQLQYKNVLLNAKQGSGLTTLIKYLEKILKVEFVIVYPEDLDEQLDSHYYSQLANRVLNKSSIEAQLGKKQKKEQMLIINGIEQLSNSKIKSFAQMSIPVIFTYQQSSLPLKTQQLLQQNKTMIYRLQNDDDKCIYALRNSVGISELKNYNYNITYIKNNLTISKQLNPTDNITQNNVIYAICARKPEYLIGITGLNPFVAQQKLITYGLPTNIQYGSFQQFSFIIDKLRDSINSRVVITRLIQLESEVLYNGDILQQIASQLISQQYDLISKFGYSIETILISLQNMLLSINIFDKTTLYDQVFKGSYDPNQFEIRNKNQNFQVFEGETYIDPDIAVLNIYEDQQVQQDLIKQVIRNHNVEISGQEDIEMIKEAVLLFDSKRYLLNQVDKNTYNSLHPLILSTQVQMEQKQKISERTIKDLKFSLLDQKIHEIQIMSQNEQENPKYEFHDGCTQAVTINCTISDLL